MCGMLWFVEVIAQLRMNLYCGSEEARDEKRGRKEKTYATFPLTSFSVTCLFKRARRGIIFWSSCFGRRNMCDSGDSSFAGHTSYSSRFWFEKLLAEAEREENMANW